jgi:hypothetical protein
MSILERIDSIINEETTNVETKKDQTEHLHGGKVNNNGDGSTTTTIRGPKHVHKIFQWLVQPNNGHTHNLED